MKIIKLILFFILIGLFISACRFSERTEENRSDEKIIADTSLVDVNLAEGEKLYKENCTPCHDIHSKIIGPALLDIDSLDRKWLYLWIKNSTELINTGNKKANKIFNDYNRIMQPNFNFTEKQIDNIVKY